MVEIIKLVLIGLLAGSLSGLLGIGGGVIIIPLLVFFLDYSQKLAQGTSLAMLLPPIGFLAAYNYYKSGYVNIKAAIVLIIFFVVGSYFTSLFATKLPEVVIKKIFAVFLLIYAIKLLIE